MRLRIRLCAFPRYFSAYVVFAIMTLIALSMKAKQGRFESMENDRHSWPTAKLISAADSLMKTGQEDEAIVLYMMAASRPAKDGSARGMKLNVEANFHAGDIHYAKGNYSNALRFSVAGLKLSEAAEEQPVWPYFTKTCAKSTICLWTMRKGSLTDSCRTSSESA